MATADEDIGASRKRFVVLRPRLQPYAGCHVITTTRLYSEQRPLLSPTQR